MAFWGVEVKPGKSFTHVHDSDRGALRITQATLGNGTASKRTVVQCAAGDKPPVLLCSLLPDKSESCCLDLEFEEEEEVIFSVIGPRSVHLTGYFISESRHGNDEEGDSDDSYEDNVWEMGSDDSGSGESEEYGEDFMSGSDEDIDASPNRANSGVVIEELSEDENPSKGNPKEDAKVGSQNQLVKYDKSPTVESEDEDGFPVTDTKNSSDNCSDAKSGSIKNEKSNKKKKKKEKAKKTSDELKEVESNPEEPQNETVPTEIGEKSGEDGAEKQKKKKNKKKKAKDADKDDQPQSQDKINGKRSAGDALEATNALPKEKKARADDSISSASKKDTETSRKPRTFANGLVIEELSMGQPNGKRASPGKTVSVRYIGKLKSGKIFDSNIGQKPFKFRLGVGQVIKGWDVGVDGMRVGDKRRLTIPPSMGYGQKGAGSAIPGNSWLLFDVELVDVK